MNLSYFNDGYRTARGNDSGWVKQGSGLFLPPKPRRYDRPIALDFFAGAGGFSLGIKRAGFHVVGAVEWWPCAADTYLHNLGSPETKLHIGVAPNPDASKKQKKLWSELAGQTIPAREFFPSAGMNHLRLKHGSEEDRNITATEHLWMADVSELTGESILEKLGIERGELDLVVGGPPCQGFSVAGRRDVTDPRNSGVFEFARLICELQPKCFAMENVPGILSMTTTEGIPVVDALCHIFEEGGMGSYESIRNMLLNTSGAGAVIRNRKPADKEPKKPEKSEDLEGQMTLFEAANG